MSKKYLLANLPQDVEQMILDGTSYAACVKELKLRQGYDLLPASELKIVVTTVATRLLNERNAKEFEKTRYKEYRIVKCKHCSKSSAKKPLAERKVGKNFPPFCDGCSCVFTIEIDE